MLRPKAQFWEPRLQDALPDLQAGSGLLCSHSLSTTAIKAHNTLLSTGLSPGQAAHHPGSPTRIGQALLPQRYPMPNTALVLTFWGWH